MNTTNLSYFTDANTCRGYFSFLPQSFKTCKNKFYIKNAASSLKDGLFEKVSRFCEENGVFHHRIMHPGYADKLCGIYIPGKDVFIFCMPFFENYCDDINATNAAKSISAEDSEKISQYSYEIARLKKSMYSHLANAKSVHDDWEKIYISNMDFQKANDTAMHMISEIFTENSQEKAAINNDRFFGSMLTGSSVNYIDNLTRGLAKRIFIKGRPGTGKSTFLKKIKNAAIERGFDTETYYCSFDPSSLDMVIIRELSLCIFDSTSPHEMFPSLASDSILDIYDIAVTDGTDEKYSKELSEIQVKYDIELAGAKKYLADIIKILNDTDSIYEKYNSEDSEKYISDILSHIL